jgi:hypothetical protein
LNLRERLRKADIRELVVIAQVQSTERRKHGKSLCVLQAPAENAQSFQPFEARDDPGVEVRFRQHIEVAKIVQPTQVLPPDEPHRF